MKASWEHINSIFLESLNQINMNLATGLLLEAIKSRESSTGKTFKAKIEISSLRKSRPISICSNLRLSLNVFEFSNQSQLFIYSILNIIFTFSGNACCWATVGGYLFLQKDIKQPLNTAVISTLKNHPIAAKNMRRIFMYYL